MYPFVPSVCMFHIGNYAVLPTLKCLCVGSTPSSGLMWTHIYSKYNKTSSVFCSIDCTHVKSWREKKLMISFAANIRVCHCYHLKWTCPKSFVPLHISYISTCQFNKGSCTLSQKTTGFVIPLSYFERVIKVDTSDGWHKIYTDVNLSCLGFNWHDLLPKHWQNVKI